MRTNRDLKIALNLIENFIRSVHYITRLRQDQITNEDRYIFARELRSLRSKIVSEFGQGELLVSFDQLTGGFHGLN